MKIFSDGDENEAEMTLIEWINAYAVSRGIDYIILDWYNNIYENALFFNKNNYVLDEEYSFGGTPESYIDVCKDYPFILEMPMYKFHEIEFDEDTHELTLTYYCD